ncbi:MAG: TolB protein, partial [Candidatus Poribacteria bacterium]|nr:TolB protein [Candidatus Poribacteria bacterium]
MKKQRVTITIIAICSIFFTLLGSQLTIAGGNDGGIIFSKYIEELEKCQIVVLTDGKRVKNLSNSDTNDFDPSWSFDGKHIAFIVENGVPPNGPWYMNIMDADGSNRRQVTKKTDNNELREFYPSFSPSGKKLIFTRSTNWNWFCTPNTPPAQFKIYTIDIDGSNERYLTDGYYAKWSPDGKKIVFQEKGNIIIMDTDGKNQVKIADGACP